MVQRSLEGRHVMMDACNEVAPSGVVVTSIAGTTKFMRISTLKIARRFNKGNDFCCVCMRYSLRVYLLDQMNTTISLRGYLGVCDISYS
jgi:hypothetical protein